MKSYLFLLTTLCAWYSCTPKSGTPKSVYIGVIVDLSDKQLLQPDAEQILPLYGFDTDKDIEGSFFLTSVTDKHITPVTEFHIPSGIITEKDNVQDDAHHREKAVLSFYNGIRTAITDFTRIHQQDSSEYSQCFSTIAIMLQKCSETKATKTIVIIHSDLREHSPLYNCYSTTGRATLEQHPNRIAQAFSKTNLLPSTLTGVTIIFSFLPRNREEDTQFFQMAAVYRKLLEARGAKVIVKANTNYETM